MNPREKPKQLLAPKLLRLVFLLFSVNSSSLLATANPMILYRRFKADASSTGGRCAHVCC